MKKSDLLNSASPNALIKGASCFAKVFATGDVYVRITRKRPIDLPSDSPEYHEYVAVRDHLGTLIGLSGSRAEVEHFILREGFTRHHVH